MSRQGMKPFLEAGLLPELPAVASRVLKRCNDPALDPRDLATAVESDPVLVDQLLKVANSSPAGGPGPIITLEKAIAVLGLRSVRLLVLGFTLIRALQRSHHDDFDHRPYWRRSISMAVAARRIAIRLGRVRVDEAFIGGLLADIGILAAHGHPSGLYRLVLTETARTGEPLCVVERRILGASHPAITAWMLRSWHAGPPFLCDAIAAHHGEGIDALESRQKTLASVLWAAALVADLLTQRHDQDARDRVRQQVVGLFSALEDSYEEILRDLNAHVQRLAETFEVDLSEEITFELMQSAHLNELLGPGDPEPRG